ncbi:hypothetical protein E4634_16175 [Mangrovimicrobium sediminis]|uniref:Uncharacterized protein n=1 Tax=Mangrovimicrobium sediminis TaxID=2562682 RepID=A0A4Z0LY93_9GAMM|nr:hypothetical protein E4634_16175 [Haliea sp. SAOS-164]
MPFLTLLDERAKPKGSRDPLGFEMVWTYFGRRVISNLTTITSSLENFATALLGFKWCNELNSHYPEHERYLKIQESFLRYEQLAGYLRFLGRDHKIMGITRVRKRLEDPNRAITFGLGAGQLILSDQASYGLWGLYSTALRDTGLVSGERRELTAHGQEIAGQIERKLGQNKRDILIEIFTSNSRFGDDEINAYSSSFVRAINNRTAREALRDALLTGNPGHEVQAEVWRVTQKIAGSSIRNMTLQRFIDELRKHTTLDRLADYLTDIEHVERLLVAANNIFHYCRRKDGESLDTILSELKGRYRYDHLPRELDLSGVPRGEALNEILDALHRGDQARVVEQILQLNSAVMEQRGGAPWVEVESGRTLRVRVPSETVELKNQAELESAWDYDYFIDSYMRVANDGLEAGWKL